MLVIGRRTDERIVIHIPASSQPREITINVTEVGRTIARLGIDAPKDCIILRGELQRKNINNGT